MRSYYRVMLGKKGAHVEECVAGGFIGADIGIDQDLTGRLPDEWRLFNPVFIPVYLSIHPEKTRIAAGLACGALFTVAKGIHQGDIVICPDGSGRIRVGEVTGDYRYEPGGVLPHRRAVHWLNVVVEREQMSEALRRSMGFTAVSMLTPHADEIERLIGGAVAPQLLHTDKSVEDATAFALEKHLEDFLVANWAQTELARDFDIYEDDGERVGRQYPTDTGPMDILCISKDRRTLLVVELKKGRASDAVVGQVLRYMGFVADTLAEDNQSVRGVIIALDDDLRMRRALSMVPSISFYRYEISFRLLKSV
jgi:restriction system protein